MSFSMVLIIDCMSITSSRNIGGGGGILWVWRLFTVSVVFMDSSVVSIIENLLKVVTWLAGGLA